MFEILSPCKGKSSKFSLFKMEKISISFKVVIDIIFFKHSIFILSDMFTYSNNDELLNFKKVNDLVYNFFKFVKLLKSIDKSSFSVYSSKYSS